MSRQAQLDKSVEEEEKKIAIQRAITAAKDKEYAKFHSNEPHCCTCIFFLTSCSAMCMCLLLYFRADEIRERSVNDIITRPNQHLLAARTQAENLRDTLQPLLYAAEQSLQNIVQLSEQHLIQAPTLLQKISKQVGHAIAANAPQLADLIFDYLIEDSIQELNRIDLAKQMDLTKHGQKEMLNDIVQVLDQYEAQQHIVADRW